MTKSCGYRNVFQQQMMQEMIVIGNDEADMFECMKIRGRKPARYTLSSHELMSQYVTHPDHPSKVDSTVVAFYIKIIDLIIQACCENQVIDLADNRSEPRMNILFLTQFLYQAICTQRTPKGPK